MRTISSMKTMSPAVETIPPSQPISAMDELKHIPDTDRKYEILAGPDAPVPPRQDNNEITRAHFPDYFIFGTGTSAFQVEGAAAEGGKGLSIWDTFTTKTPQMIDDGSNGNVACDMYHKYKEDIKTMKNMGFKAYRFSISWPRILPGGRCSAGINREGINFYNDLIDAVIDNGMEPYATLFHWDLPDALEKEYGGFLSKDVVPDFVEYAELCFWEFGDRVKMWTTLNEPWTVAHHGYVNGIFPPSKPTCEPDKCHTKLPPYRCCIPKDNQPHKTLQTCLEYSNKLGSNPAKDPYTVTRNLLLCHAAAYRRYEAKFKKVQKGNIGIVLNSHWYVAFNEESEDDKKAARRAVDFMLGCYLDPILNGRFPKSVVDEVKEENLETFTPEEWRMVDGSIDYLGLNYYTTKYAEHHPEEAGVIGYAADKKIKYDDCRDGKLIGPRATGSTWLNIVPWGIYAHLKFLKETYLNLPPIYITENGVAEANYSGLTALEACRDPHRVKYHQDHLANILQAMVKLKVDVRGYFAWSWCDNFEWKEGYKSRFGLMYVDFINNQTRYPKDSAVWFFHFLHNETMPPVVMPTLCPCKPDPCRCKPDPCPDSCKRKFEDTNNGTGKRNKC